MAANTVAFTLTSAAYQDVSGGYDICSFRLPLRAPKNNVIHVHLGTSLPATDTVDFDEFMAPQQISEEWEIHFNSLGTSRVYVKAATADSLTIAKPIKLTVYRK